MQADNAPYELHRAPYAAQAPATGTALKVDRFNQHFPLAITAENETNTLGDPTQVGQKITISAISIANSGYRWITAASQVNDDGNTIMKFHSARDRVVLESTFGTSQTDYEWVITCNEGVDLA